MTDSTAQQVLVEGARAEADAVRGAVEALVAAHRLLGREGQRLDEERAGAGGGSEDRAATVRRMRTRISDAAGMLSRTVADLCQLIGLLECGIDSQSAEDAEGKPYSPLAPLPDRAAVFLDAVEALASAVGALRAAYTPTRKHPALAVPRDREAVAGVVGHLLAAARRLEALFVPDPDSDSDGAGEFAANVLGPLSELEEICRPRPVRPEGMSDEDILALVLSDPALAEKAARALGRTPGLPLQAGGTS